MTFRRRTSGAEANRLTFDDGGNCTIEAVVWATGYRHDDTWIGVPGALDDDGVLLNDNGVTPVRGLFTLGRPWQRDRGSALLGYVHRDAEGLAARFTGSTA
ncbi:hypothetical protein GCM10009823_23850 [Brevibacterium salitolerans]|uniref:Flavoprotein involved in K+ transport n=1 Tax=Brevibacterium salitolerans TaxID=1403566 RepID=A0ABN2WYB8_9MICO